MIGWYVNEQEERENDERVQKEKMKHCVSMLTDKKYRDRHNYIQKYLKDNNSYKKGMVGQINDIWKATVNSCLLEVFKDIVKKEDIIKGDGDE